jgi:hypothetical protein
MSQRFTIVEDLQPTNTEDELANFQLSGSESQAPTAIISNSRSPLTAKAWIRSSLSSPFLTHLRESSLLKPVPASVPSVRHEFPRSTLATFSGKRRSEIPVHGRSKRRDGSDASIKTRKAEVSMRQMACFPNTSPEIKRKFFLPHVFSMISCSVKILGNWKIIWIIPYNWCPAKNERNLALIPYFPREYHLLTK